MQQLELSYNSGGSVNWCNLFGKCLPPSNKLNMNIPYNPEKNFTSTGYPRENPAQVHQGHV